MLVNDTRAYHETKPGHLDTETTFSMLFTANYDRTKTGNSYGIILAHEAYAKRFAGLAVVPRNIHVVTLGPGLGWSDGDFLCELDRIGQDFECTAIDIAPNLIENSLLRELMSKGAPIKYVQADAQEIRDVLDDESVDIFIANEMVGDLLTLDEIEPELLTCDPGKLGSLTPHHDHVRKLRRMIAQHGIPVDPAQRLAYNLGGIQLVEDLGSIMRPKSLAFVSEHSCEQPRLVYNGHSLYFIEPERIPNPYTFGDAEDNHVEYTTRFSDLEIVAKSVGFGCERGRLVDFIGIRDDTMTIPSFVLEELMDARGILASDFVTRVVEPNQHLFPEYATNLQFANMYILEHPEILKQALGMTEAEYGEEIEPRSMPAKQHHGRFEYLIMTKPFL